MVAVTQKKLGRWIDELTIGVLSPPAARLRTLLGPDKPVLLLLLGALVPAMLVTVNVISGAKQVQVLAWAFAAGTVFFPITYVFDDIITEVYGEGKAQLIICATFFAQLFCIFAITVSQALPPAAFLKPEEAAAMQAAFSTALGTVPRINIASLIAVLFGRMANAHTLAWIKRKYPESSMFWRFVMSTFAGELVDTILFLGIAFVGRFAVPELVAMVITQYIFKVLWEIIAYPLTYPVVVFVKLTEEIPINAPVQSEAEASVTSGCALGIGLEPVTVYLDEDRG